MSAEAFGGFPAGTFTFLRGIAAHNDKAWFQEHRADHDEFYVGAALRFVESIGPRLRAISRSLKFEARVNGSLFRIQRDVRFSKDKSPYKTHLDLWFWAGERRGWDSPGCFFRMFHDRLIIGAGMHQFEKAQLAAYREAALDGKRGRALVEALDQVRRAGPYTIGGATRKSVPRGFDGGHERAPLLLHEGLFATLEARASKQARTPGFVDYCLGHLAAMWPVARWIQSAL